jgi:hypothetical protein
MSFHSMNSSPTPYLLLPPLTPPISISISIILTDEKWSRVEEYYCSFRSVRSCQNRARTQRSGLRSGILLGSSQLNEAVRDSNKKSFLQAWNWKQFRLKGIRGFPMRKNASLSRREPLFSLKPLYGAQDPAHVHKESCCLTSC